MRPRPFAVLALAVFAAGGCGESGPSPEDVARALVRPRPWEARDAEGTEEEGETNMVTMWC